MLACLLMLGGGLIANAQTKAPLSPKDSVETALSSGADLKIVYSRPSLRNRDITTIVPFGKVWRTGANAATIFEVSQDVTVGGKAVPAGKYSLYTIPGKENTTVILNKTWSGSGLAYDQANDFVRFEVPTKMTGDQVEQFTIKAETTGEVDLLWSNWDIAFTVE